MTVPEEDATVLIDDEPMATVPNSEPTLDADASPKTSHMAPISIRGKRSARIKPSASASPRIDPSLFVAGASLKGEDLSRVHSGYASIIVTPFGASLGEDGADTDGGDAEGCESTVERPVSAKSVRDSISLVATPLDAPMSPDQHYSLCSMIEYGVSSEQGTRKTMEDRHTARLTEKGKSVQQHHADEDPDMDDDVTVEDTPEETLAQGVPFFGVYDGHGGTQCAAYLRKKLDKLVLGHPKVIDEPEVALREAIDFAEQEFLDQFKEDSSGSTAAVAIIVGNKIVTANVGDTEIVLNRGGVALCLSEKHNVKSSEAERERVVAAGGRLYQNARVAHPLYNPQVLSLGVSRAIGDSGFKLKEYTQGKPSGVVATASTFTTDFNPATDEFLLIGCDGVWDVMSHQQAVDYCVEVQQNGIESIATSPQTPLTPQQISSALVTRALELGSNDNVTAMFISLRSRPRSANHRPPSAVHERWGERARSARKLTSESTAVDTSAEVEFSPVVEDEDVNATVNSGVDETANPGDTMSDTPAVGEVDEKAPVVQEERSIVLSHSLTDPQSTEEHS